MFKYDWFIRFRWSMIATEILIIFGSGLYLNNPVAGLKIFLIALVLVASNIYGTLLIKENKYEKQVIGSWLILDILILTIVLQDTGGAKNPFTLLYLLNTVLAAVFLPNVWIWITTVVSSLAFATLFLLSDALSHEHIIANHDTDMSHHLYGMLFSHIAVATLIAYFLSKIISEQKLKDLKMESLRNIAQQQQKLANLTAITANSLHELGSPLSTIELICHELSRKDSANSDFSEDLKLLVSESNRCKETLATLSAQIGHFTSDGLGTIMLSKLVNNIIDTKIPIELKQSDYDVELAKAHAYALQIAIKSLIKNGYEASKKSINLNIKTSEYFVEIEIVDQGCGMSPEVLARLGEPFFSTKDKGSGMGLGIYIAKLTLEQIGATISFESKISFGTKVLIKFPL
jgi:two-component system, sensor histidine kinase RegB